MRFIPRRFLSRLPVPTPASADRSTRLRVVRLPAGSLCLCFSALLLLCVPAGAADEPGFGPQSILSLAPDPANVNRIYAGTQGWGLALSTDGGRTWSATDPELNLLSVTAVAVHPSGRVVYAGTRSRGLFLSSDGGASFEPAGRGLPDPEVRSIALDPLEQRRLFVATAAGLAMSPDAGRSWRVFAQLPRDVHDIVTSPLKRSPRREPSILPFDETRRRFEVGNEPTVFAVADGAVWGCETSNAVCEVLLDSKRSLELGGERLSEHKGDELHLVIPQSEPDVLYVGAPFGLFRSLDRGRHWTFFPGLTGIRALAAHPKKAHVLRASSDQGLVVSIDGGISFQVVPDIAAEGWRILVAHPHDPFGFVAGSTDGRVAVRMGGQVQVAALRGTQVQHQRSAEAPALPLSRLPAESERPHRLGAHVNQSVDALVVDPRFPDIVYAGTRYGVFRSVDQGRSWQPRRAGLGDVEVLDLVLDSADSYAADPRNEARLLAATNGHGLFRSVDSGASWQPVRGLPDPVVRSLTQDPADAGTVYAGTRSMGIFFSRDGGQSWRGAEAQPRQLGIRDLAVTPLCVYAAADFGAVFESRDRGLTWKPLGLESTGEAARRVAFPSREPKVQALRRVGLDDRGLHVNAVVADPERDGALLAATAFGVFSTVDHGASWRRVAPWHNAVDLTRHPTDPERLLAATAQGLLFSADGGGTWIEHKRKAMGAVAFDPVFSSRAYVGDDHGTVRRLRLRDTVGGDGSRRSRDAVRVAGETSLPAPTMVPSLDRKAEPAPLESPVKPGFDAFQTKRSQVLRALDALPHDPTVVDARVGILLLLEAHARRETGDLDVARLSAWLLDSMYALQLDFVQRGGVGQVSLAPDGHTLAAAYRWHDGLESRSEIRLFDLRRQGLMREPALSAAGPSPFWKELHDPFRRPTQLPPNTVLEGAGRLLAWGVDGRIVVSRSGADEITLWGTTSGRPERVIGGFPAPPRKASLSPRGNVLGVIGYDGHVVRADTRSQTLFLPPTSESPARAVTALDDGLLVAQADGTVAHWSLDGKGTAVLDTVGPATHELLSPDGRWWMLGAVEPEALESEPAEDSSPLEPSWTHTYLVDLEDPELAAYVLGEADTWQEARFSPDGTRLWLRAAGDLPAQLVDMGPLQEGRSMRIFDLEAMAEGRFDPVNPLLVTPKSTWNLVQEPFVDGNGIRHRQGRLLAQGRSRLRDILRLFGTSTLPVRRRVSGLAPVSGRSTHSVDGSWSLAFDDEGNMASEFFGQAESRYGQVEPREEISPSRTVGLALVSLRRHGGEAPSPVEVWPRGLLPDAPWADADEDNGFDVLRTWGCSLAGRNFNPDEWKRFFGSEPYRATCRFEPVKTPSGPAASRR